MSYESLCRIVCTSATGHHNHRTLWPVKGIWRPESSAEAGGRFVGEALTGAGMLASGDGFSQRGDRSRGATQAASGRRDQLHRALDVDIVGP
jgi:hypothetical protein